MCRKLVTSLGAAALLVWLGAGTAQAVNNPSGWIQTDGWNLLLPLTGTGCDGGGAAKMQRNWIAPHVIGLANPKAGTTYFDGEPFDANPNNDKIDFGKTAAATGWGGGSLGVPDPSWVTTAFLEAGFATTDWPNGDVVDYQAIVEYANTKVLTNPAFFPPPAPPALPHDNVLGIATTYVENTSGAAMEVEICTASDDSIQVWVNNILITNVSACRGTAGGCAETRPAILPTGVSKIATLTHEGGGGWGFRLGIRIGGVLITDATAGAAGLAFLGPGDAATVGQVQYSVARSRFGDDPIQCTGGDVTNFRLQGEAGSGPGAGGDLLTVVETITPAPSPAPPSLGTAASPRIVVSDVSNGGTVADSFGANTLDPPVPLLPLSTHVGADCGAGSMSIDNGGGSYTNISTSNGDIWNGGDSFEFQYAVVAGDFDIAVELTGYAHSTNAGRWGKFGLMARQDFDINSRYTMAQAHGPSNSDGARQAGRTAHLVSGALYEVGFPTLPPRPRFLRLTRRGNVVRGWASTNPGLADGTLNPCNDGNWVGANSDDWGAGAPLALNVGFANSEHNSDTPAGVCPIQTLNYRIISCMPLASPPLLSKTITWTGVTRATVDDPGLTYKVSTPNSSSSVHEGEVSGESTIHRTSLGLLFVTNSGPVGIFDDSRDIGSVPTVGSTTLAGDCYEVKGSGGDIWDGGDQFHFAYKAVTGDFVMTARVDEIRNPPNARWGRLGLMARNNCNAASKYSMAVVPYRGEDPNVGGTHAVPGNDARRHQSRRDHLSNGTTRDQQVVPAGKIVDDYLGWIRLTRIGDYIYSEFAEDVAGVPGTWVLAGGDTDINRPDDMLVGLASSSHGTGGANTLDVTFCDVSFSTPTAPAAICASGAVLVDEDFTALPAQFQGVTNNFVPAIVGDRLRITQDGTNGTAAAARIGTDGLALGDTAFVAEFDVYLSKPMGTEADGGVFAIIEGDFASGTGRVGGGGGEAGYNFGDHNAIPHQRRASLAMEFDTWDGGHGDTDPPGGYGGNAGGQRWHTAIDFNEDMQSAQNQVEFGVGSTFTLVNNAMGAHMELYYIPMGDTSLVRTYLAANDGTFPRTQVGEVVGPRLRGEVYLAFTGGTGGANETKEVDNLKVTELCCEGSAETVVISGPETSTAGTAVTLTATTGGLDGPAALAWSKVSGPAGATVVDNGDGTATVNTPADDPGEVVVEATLSDGVCGNTASDQHTVDFEAAGALRKPNDFDSNGALDIADPVATLNHLFSGGVGPPCGDGSILDQANLDLLDADDNGEINLADPVRVLNYLFTGGPPPANCLDEFCPCIQIVGCLVEACNP